MSKDSADAGVDCRDGESLGVTSPAVTRRDFVGNTLQAAGAGALLAAIPGIGSQARAQGLSEDWTGPGGVGDYAMANGNTAQVVNAAHRIRDGAHDARAPAFEDTNETYDLVVVGGGVAGLAAAHTLYKTYGGERNCLVLENHAMFGGESRGNQVQLDGYLLTGPQGANQSANVTQGEAGKFQREIGLPEKFDFADAEGLARPLKIGDDHYDALFGRQKLFNKGWYLGPQHGWFRDPDWVDGFAALPWPADFKARLAAWFNYTKNHAPQGVAGGTNDPRNIVFGDDPTEDTALGRWLDTMSYFDYVRDVMRLDPQVVARYADPYLAITVGGSMDTVSAYSARILNMPGVSAATWRSQPQDSGYTLPMGNAIYPRLLVRAMLPKVYADGSIATLMYGGRARLEELDRPQSPTRIRLNSTVVRVEHEGSYANADTVSIVYDQGGKLRRVRARGVVMASGSWISRRIVKGMPEDLQAAFQSFHHAPVLVANLAVRHWRYLEKLGISAARWFDGFGFTTCVRRPLRIDGKAEVLSPDKPTMLTFYIPFVSSDGQAARVQTITARQKMFDTSFAGFELQIRRQMQEMFGAHGFDARRDVGALILNRWGHAFCVPEAGFYYDRPGKPAARTLVRQGFGRIAFGYSELMGHQSWMGAFNEARRAVRQVS
jgi:spermidine dehydrogenase